MLHVDGVDQWSDSGHGGKGMEPLMLPALLKVLAVLVSLKVFEASTQLKVIALQICLRYL